VALACERHDPGGEWWMLTELGDVERALRNISLFDRLRPGVSDSLRAARDELLDHVVDIRERVVPGSIPGTKVCPRCAEEIKLAAAVCRFCGYEFDGSPSSVGASKEAPTTTSGVAIAAFITSLVGLWFASIPLGISAQRAIDRSNGRIGGRGFATAGIVLGVIGIIGTVILIIALVHAANNPGCTYTYNATGGCVPGT
jgi:hypothetical protein